MVLCIPEVLWVISAFPPHPVEEQLRSQTPLTKPAILVVTLSWWLFPALAGFPAPAVALLTGLSATDLDDVCGSLPFARLSLFINLFALCLALLLILFFRFFSDLASCFSLLIRTFFIPPCLPGPPKLGRVRIRPTPAAPCAACLTLTVATSGVCPLRLACLASLPAARVVGIPHLDMVGFPHLRPSPGEGWIAVIREIWFLWARSCGVAGLGPLMFHRCVAAAAADRKLNE